MPSRTDQSFADLRAAGYTGSINDMERQRLLSILGLTSSTLSLADLYAQAFESPDAYSFNPFRLANLELALDADRIQGLNDGDPVTQWNDISGKGHHFTQAVASQKPTYRKKNKNLLSYDSATFETGVGDWAPAAQSPSPVRTTADKFSGTGALELTYAVSGVDSLVNIVITNVKPNTSYTFRAKRKITVYNGPNVAIAGKSRMLWMQTDTVPNVAANTVAAAEAVDASWVYETCALTTPSDVNHLTIRLYAINGTVLWDEIGLYETADVPAGGPDAWLPPIKLPNNKPTVQFDGINDTISLADYGVDPRELSVYLVYTTQATPKNDAALLEKWELAGAYPITIRANKSGTGQINVATYDGTLNPSAFSAPIGYNEQSYVICGQRTLTQIKESVNGIVTANPDTTSATPNDGNAAWWIGSRGNSTNWLLGGISALLVFSEAHDDATRSRIEKWLGNKYGIAVA